MIFPHAESLINAADSPGGWGVRLCFEPPKTVQRETLIGAV